MEDFASRKRAIRESGLAITAKINLEIFVDRAPVVTISRNDAALYSI